MCQVASSIWNEYRYAGYLNSCFIFRLFLHMIRISNIYILYCPFPVNYSVLYFDITAIIKASCPQLFEDLARTSPKGNYVAILMRYVNY